MTDEDRTSQALALHQAGALVAAAQLYARILDADPGHAHVRQQLTSIEADILLHLDIGIDPSTYYPSFAPTAGASGLRRSSRHHRRTEYRLFSDHRVRRAG